MLLRAQAPVITERLLAKGTPVSALALSSAKRVQTAKPTVALVAADGTINVQVLAAQLAVPVQGEGDLLQTRLHSIM